MKKFPQSGKCIVNVCDAIGLSYPYATTFYEVCDQVVSDFQHTLQNAPR